MIHTLKCYTGHENGKIEILYTEFRFQSLE